MPKHKLCVHKKFQSFQQTNKPILPQAGLYFLPKVKLDGKDKLAIKEMTFRYLFSITLIMESDDSPFAINFSTTL